MFSNLLIIFGAKYLLWVLIGMAFIWFLKQPRERQKRIIFFAITAFPVIYAVSRIVAGFYYNPRPFVVDNFTPLIPHEPNNGFPSDHTLLSAAVATVIYPLSKKVGAISWVMAILVGTSRVLAGIHHPIDIAGSIIIAIFGGFITYHILPKKFDA